MANAPTPTATATTPANAGGSNKSTPAPKVGVPASLKKWLWLGVIVVTIVTIIALIASTVREESRKQKQAEKATTAIGTYGPRSEVPLASSPQSSWPKLVISAKGKSQFVPRPSGMKIRMAGQKFEGFNVFENSECSFLKACPEGSLGAYARNLSEEENTISYAYVPD